MFIVVQTILLWIVGHDEIRAGVEVSPEVVPVLFDVVKIDFQLRILEQRIAVLRGMPTELDEAMEMHQAVAHAAGKLADSGYSTEKIVSRLENAREGIDQSAAIRAEHIAAKYRLPVPVTNAFPPCQDNTVRLPCIVAPAPLQCNAVTADELAAAKARSNQSLMSLPELSCAGQILSSASVKDTLSWMKHESLAPGKRLQPAQVVIREVEAMFFSSASQGCIEDVAVNLGPQALTEMIELIHRYRAVVDNFLSISTCHVPMVVEVRSRERLVTWVAYAIAFAVTRSVWPHLMQGYGTALSPSDLRHFVLSDRASKDAMLQVATYLRRHTQEGKYVFSLADDGDATFEFAAQVGRNSTHIRTVWESEVKAAKHRQYNHWELVKRKKKECARLRVKLAVLNTSIIHHRGGLRSAKSVQNKNCSSQEKCHDCMASGLCKARLDVISAEKTLSVTEKDLGQTKAHLRIAKEVSPVLQPLPDDETAAFGVLFFLFMPEEFRALSLLSFMGQQMLLPRKWDDKVEKAVKASQCTMKWSRYYNKHRSSRFQTVSSQRRGGDGDVVLGLFGEIPKPETSVDLCSRPTDGVWHPDDVAPGRMLWNGGQYKDDRRSQNFNPFSRCMRPEWLVVENTEKLEDESLQWAMAQHGFDGTHRTRGNRAIATQGDAPTWLDKVEFLTFGSLRAYPLLQLRKLAVALRERSLALDQNDARKLVCQALFHVGEISSLAPIRLIWREDEMDEFSAIFDELKVSLRDHYKQERFCPVESISLGGWNC